MQALLEYIIANYTLFLCGAIIILLAIIGYYADKTNFGQGKKDESIDNDLSLEQNKEFNIDAFDSIVEKTNNEEQKTVAETEEIIEVPRQNLEKTVNSEISFEEQFRKFDKEFNDILPKKEIIDDELLDEIENLSLDKTQKIKLSDIPDLDDVELPKIKSLEPQEEDIWKF